jgi:hypothetical protein
VFGDSDGVVHAIDAASGRELSGWPVTTNPTVPAHSYPGINPGHEPVVSPAAVGDLRHDGHLEVVVTSATGRVYVFDAHGHRLVGWPKLLATGAVTPAIPLHPAHSHRRARATGPLPARRRPPARHHPGRVGRSPVRLGREWSVAAGMAGQGDAAG